MKTLKIISVIIAALLFVAATVVAAFFVAYFILTSDVKLDEEKLASRTPACVIYADDGNIIEESVQTNYVTIDKIPDITKKAFIATEDKRFYDHGGVDVKGILKGILKGSTGDEASSEESTSDDDNDETLEKLAKIIAEGDLEEKADFCRENFPPKLAEKLLQKICGFNEKESKFIIEN